MIDYATQSRVTDPGPFADHGSLACQACRAGAADPARFCVDPGPGMPDTWGWPQVRHNLIQDLASLARDEMLLWDDWGLDQIEGEPTPDQLELLDALAAATCSSYGPAETILAFFQRDEFRMPPVVTSYRPAHDVPRQVAI